MGRTRNKISRQTKKKTYKKRHDVKHRRKDIDQIQEDLKRVESTGTLKVGVDVFEHDDDLPGLGQYFCISCARHFTDEKSYNTHVASKLHKRRLKDLAQEQYTHTEADAAAGMTKEVLPSVTALREKMVL